MRVVAERGRRMRRVAAVVVALSLGGGVLAACTPAPSGPPVAVLFPGAADDAWGSGAEVLRSELARDGYAVEVRFAGDDIPLQLDQLHAVLEAQPAAVVIAPVDATAVAAVLDDEAPDGVAVIAYDELVVNSAEVDYFATFDHRAAGRMRAEALVQRLTLDAPGPALALELMAGSGDERGAREAFAGSLEVLQPYLDAGRVTVPSGRVTLERAAITRGDPAVAADRVAAVLADGTVLAGVLCPSDEMAAAVAGVLADAGLAVAADVPAPVGGAAPSGTPSPDPSTSAAPGSGTPGPEAVPSAPEPPAASVVLTGGGQSLAGARAVQAGELTATVFEDPRELARVVASMVREVVRHEVPTVTAGATVDNGLREVPTRMVQPRRVDSLAAAAELLG